MWVSSFFPGQVHPPHETGCSTYEGPCHQVRPGTSRTNLQGGHRGGGGGHQQWGRLACTQERLSHLKGFKFTLSAPPNPSAGWTLAETFLVASGDLGLTSGDPLAFWATGPSPGWR